MVDQLSDLTKFEKHDYGNLLRHKLGFNKYGPAISGLNASGGGGGGGSGSTAAAEAKDLVEKAPVVLKKGLTKEEANPILEKLKELGATVVLE
ncbi:hypothetical protein MKW92_031173 [Papaver armeniacum]|nr:hypothetical protein MKW92_031173 [Papaver armeniacum]